MANDFRGCTVSITCKNGVGVYQGIVSEVNHEIQIIYLSKPFKNGVPCPEPQVALSAHIIQDIQIIKKAEPQKTADTSTVIISKPIAKRPQRTVSESIANFKPGASTANSASSKQTKKSNTRSESPRLGQSVEDRFQSALFVDSSRKNPRHRWTERDEACFGEPIKPHHFQKEFDFEKNLAKFNKQAVFEEINAQQKPDLVRQTEKYNRVQKGNDITPVRLRQAPVNMPCTKEYITDEGLTVPCISSSLRDQLFTAAQDLGLGFPRLAELMGRATAEVAIPLLGGTHRLNPLNNQQKPLVVVLAGPCKSGALAINAARQLTSQGVDTIVFLNQANSYNLNISQELGLYHHTGHKVVVDIYELPNKVDLVIVGLADENTSKIDNQILNWANDNKAVLVAVDPPPQGTPGLSVRFSLVPTLPLSYSNNNGNLFLVNMAIPQKVFTELNIKYRSPFGSKFVIPLHTKD